ncbi:MAG: caspase family protein [Candidatus Thiodiazotropha sp. (ex Dulcina madagascariensis)]|nr:caspase family protein [Candidatus Thiodiazotropha sp. (ex Dulcina madagascariensis)]MCU7928172.1 caspase family protein [Candidatus Thiodiazotropha sp. (ex Dulcina madagascariensis)]
MSAVIWKDQALIDGDDPIAHAIVIGVGDYPHLVGGTGLETPKNGGLRQLASPPVSAYTFATWLLGEFNNPDAPLASLSLLVSDADNRDFTHPKLVAPAKPLTADSVTTVKALRAWKTLGDSNEDNLMLFFFCGHGVARGLDGLTLLLRDYGEEPNMPMEGAIDFAAFQRGMAQCAASRQCFFVDACRQVSDIARNTSESGKKVIQDDINRPFASDWNYAVLFATVEGESAYGRPNKPSFYTEALVKGLDGTAANNRNAHGEWRVSTSELNQAIHRSLSLRGKKIKNPAVRLVDFEFHLPKQDPVIPVTVFCDPKDDNVVADLFCEQHDIVVASRGPAPEDWVTELASGSYDFQAQIGARTGQRPGVFVLPPYREIAIKVTP